MTSQQESHVAALVLAAGAGSRIGSPKALLHHQGKSYLSLILENLERAGVREIIVVVSPAIHDAARSIAAGRKLVINPDPATDMMSSLRLGLRAIDNAAGCLVIPVDHPFVRPETYRKLVDTFLQYPDEIAKPIFKKSGGHPIAMPLQWARRFTEPPLTEGLRSAIRQSGIPINAVEVDDPGVLQNVNTVADLKNTVSTPRISRSD